MNRRKATICLKRLFVFSKNRKTNYKKRDRRRKGQREKIASYVTRWKTCAQISASTGLFTRWSVVFRGRGPPLLLQGTPLSRYLINCSVNLLQTIASSPFKNADLSNILFCYICCVILLRRSEGQLGSSSSTIDKAFGYLYDYIWRPKRNMFCCITLYVMSTSCCTFCPINPAIAATAFCQVCGYLSSRRASAPFGQYRMILLCVRGTRV